MRAETSPASVFHIMKIVCDRPVLHKEPAPLVMKRLAPVQSAVIEEDPMAASGSTVKIQEGSGPLVDRLPFDDGEYRRRLDGVRAEMAKQDIGAFISFTPEN